ncbi:SDR family NAD(P)-dependent oxidoreductase [Polaribacter butkevichii]|uniref:3-oxoacyl-ACP reductase n=1 Tax=Polaribacter butkevichii TaxID=218490 RepID=A0A2P6CCP7_9FLAO|nr:SDR family oxidoreductase [Polaribacter butkevichii]PQJ72679.1 3-oxoacyl-ACP reductase [Polaribacter butkevichii]
MKVFSLQGKKAVITGGGSGIGLGIAKTFIAAGAQVLIVGRNEEKLIDAQRELGANCSYKAFDVTDLDKVPNFVTETETSWGQVDILINCAGTHLKKNAVETSDSEFLQVLNVHLLSVFALTREFSKVMIPRQQGVIIMISSMTAVMGMKQVVAYSTAKTAVVGLMRSMVSELAIDNVRINTIAPGWIESPMLHKAIGNDLPRKTKILSRIPSSKFGQPEDIGNAALYLASDAGKYVNGVFLPIDGGAAGGF